MTCITPSPVRRARAGRLFLLFLAPVLLLCPTAWADGPIATDGGAGPATAERLLLTEVVVTPTEGEFIEIHNPNAFAVDLSNVYLSDATFTGIPSTFYYNLPTGMNVGGGAFSDFTARFPDGATIAAGEFQTVALAGSDDFFAEYGVDPDYELYEDGASADAIPDMREAFAGSINDQGGLSNGGEVVILFFWDGATDLVTDLDYALWGDGAEAVDKTGVSIDGPDGDMTATAYQDDTATGSQDVISSGAHGVGEAYRRTDLDEGAETQSGSNGVGGADETSEDLSNSWDVGPPTPGGDVAPPPGAVEIFEIQGSGAASPFEGMTVTTEDNVVTAVTGNGFYLQTPDVRSDGDATTSDGIFVFTSSSPTVMVGDQVDVTGTVVPSWSFSTSPSSTTAASPSPSTAPATPCRRR